MIKLPDRHFWVLTASLVLSSLSVWGLLSHEVTEIAEADEPAITRLHFAEVSQASALYSKPLFNKDRRFLGEYAEETDLTPDLPPTTPPPLPTLVGVATGRGKAIAMLKGQDGTTQNLKTGESIDGWHLVAINRSGATLRAEGITQKIDLDYSNKALGGPDYSNPAPNPKNAAQRSEGQYNE